MVSWWRGENTAEDATRVSDASLQNGATFTAGKVGAAFSFDGIDDFADVPHTNALNPAGTFSVEAWINAHASQLSGDGRFVIADKAHGYTDNTGWFLQGTVTERIGFGFGNGSSFAQVTTTSIVTDGLWHHVLGVYTGSELRIYFDGVLQGTAAASGTPAGNTRNVAIGRSWGGGTPERHFRGKVDELTFYGSALTAFEVSALYTAGTAGKCLDHPYFVTRTLADGRVTVPYYQKLETTLTPAPHTFQLIAGSLPAGMNLTSAGVLLGTPTSAETSAFTVRATDNLGVSSDQTFTLLVDNVACTPIPPGMIAWWRGEGNALDELGRRHGNLRTDDPANPVQFVAGRQGLAFRKPNGNSRIEFPHDAEFNAGPGEPLSIEFWWGVEHVAGPPRVFDKAIHPVDDSLANYLLRYTGAELHWGPATWQYNISASGLHHVVVTYQDPDWKIYVNGQLRATASGAINEMNAAPLAFGRGFFGILDEMALYNRALTDAEVSDLFSAPGGKRRDQLFFPPGALRPGKVSVPYFQRLGSGAIAGPKAFSIVGGSLPAGLELTEDGSIEGTPVTMGNYPVRFRLTDAFGNAVEKDEVISVADCLNQPVAWWPCDGNMRDAIGTNHGSEAGIYVDDGHGGLAKKGRSNIPHSDVVSFAPAEPVTMEFRGNVLWGHFIQKAGGGSSNYEFFNEIINFGAPAILHWQGSGGGSASSAPGQWAGGRSYWSHVVVTFDGTISKMYINGVRSGTSVIGPLGPENAGPLVFGASFDANEGLDDVAIYPNAMSAAEVAALYVSASMGEGRCGALYIATTSPLLPAGQGLAFSQAIQSQLGIAPYTYSVSEGALPDGLDLSPAGLLSGAPTGYGMHRFTVKVTDSVGHEATRKFGMDINGKPVIPAPVDRTLDELTALTVPVGGADPYPPGNTITYSLVDPPAGAAVESDGNIAWTPTEAQGPGVYLLTMQATDNGTPSLTTVTSFTVTVSEVNNGPELAPLVNRIINPGQTVSFTAAATDGDLPSNALAFSLVNPPVGAAIDPLTGLLIWRPELALAASTHPLTVKVTDSGTPPLSHTQSFDLTINPMQPVSLAAVGVTDGAVVLQVDGPVGPDYIIQWSDNLADWENVSSHTPDTMPLIVNDLVGPDVHRRFYRMLIGP